MKEIPFHPAADIFPLLEGPRYEALVADIRDHGMKQPILLYRGQIIDGRNRYRACRELGESPKDIPALNQDDYEVKDPVDFVLSLNLHRRQLTPSQWAMVCAAARELRAEMAKERMSAGGKTAGRGRPKSNNENGDANLRHPIANAGRSSQQAAAGMPVSGRLVDHAAKVTKQGTPELAQAVRDGRLAVTAASRLATATPEEQRAAVEAPKKRRKAKVDCVWSAFDQANRAIEALEKIHADDPDRKVGLKMVSDWIARNL